MSAERLQKDLTLTAEIKLYYDLFVPSPSVAAGPAPLLIAAHGYGAHKGYMMREARAVAPEDFVIASVQAPHQHFRKKDNGYRVGFGWLTDFYPNEYVRLHHKFLIDLIDRLSAEKTIDRQRVFLYGFSQACALNFKFAFTHPAKLCGLIGVCGGVPGDLETNAAYRPFGGKTLYLYGDDDEFYTREQFAAFDAALGARLPRYASHQYRAGHEITDEMRARIKNFLAIMPA